MQLFVNPADQEGGLSCIMDEVYTMNEIGTPRPASHLESYSITFDDLNKVIQIYRNYMWQNAMNFHKA